MQSLLLNGLELHLLLWSPTGTRYVSSLHQKYFTNMDGSLAEPGSTLNDHIDTETTAYLISFEQITSINVPPPGCQELPLGSSTVGFPASTLSFDTQQELLWVGNEFVSYLFNSIGVRDLTDIFLGPAHLFPRL